MLKIKFLEFVENKKRKYNSIKIAELIMKLLIIHFILFEVYFLADSVIINIFHSYYLGMGLKAIFAISFIYLTITGYSQILNKFQIARLVDKENGDKHGTFLNATDIYFDKNQRDNEFSTLIFAKANHKISDSKNILNKSNIINFSLILSVIIMINIFQIYFVQANYSEKFSKYFQIKKPTIHHKNYIQLVPENSQITRNSDIDIKVIDPELNVQHQLFYKISDEWRQKEMLENHYTFQNLDYSFHYFIKNDYAVSDTFMIKVFDLPTVTRIDIKFDYPKYSGLKSKFETEANGNIKALENTKIRIKITANNNIEEARMLFSAGETINMERIGKKTFSAEFILKKDGNYHFQLIDFLGNKSNKIVKKIEVIKDKKPEVKILYPAKDTLMTQNMLFPIDLFAADDFGITKIDLHYNLNFGKNESLNIKQDVQSSINFEYIFDMNRMDLIPSDKVNYWISVTDNSPQKQTTNSKKFVVRFPSIEEIYKEIEREEKQKSGQLSTNLKKAKELNKDFEQKRRDLMRKDKIDWEDKKQLKDLLDQQKDLKDNVENITNDYQKLIDKFEKNDALSQETIKKMQKIQELMQEISNKDLQDAMKEMQDSMKNMDKDVLKKAMENMKFSMEDYTKKLEQTIELLETIKKEQNLQKSLEIAEELHEMQSKLNEKTADENSDKQKLAEEQKNLEKKLDALEKQMAKSDSLLDKNKDAEIKEMMKKLQEQLEKQQLKKDMQEASENMQNGEMQQAQKNQKSALEQMKEMMEQLSKMNQKMSSGGMQQMSEAIQKAIDRLVIFSKKHQTSKAMYLNDPFVILKQQIAIFEGIGITLSELYKEPQIAFMLSQKFLYDVNFMKVTYRDMFQDINDAKFNKVDNFLQDIQKAFSLMIFDLIQSKNNMQSSGGSGSGMQQMMQMMQQMGQQQMAMNMLTQQLMQQMQNGGKMTNGMRGQLQRLAQDEQRLADNIRRMIQTNKEAQQQANSLNRLADELEGISRQISRNRIDQSLIDRQDKILSRLLEAQKSIHKRDKSKKRRAEQSENEWDTPETIIEKFEEMRRKAILEKEYQNFPPEYQMIIKEYLKLLNKNFTEEIDE